MKRFLIYSMLIFNSLLLRGQATQTHLIVQDTLGNPIPGATIAYYDMDDKVIITDVSYLERHAFVNRSFKFLTVWRTGYQISRINKTDIVNDTTIIHLKSIRYNCPKFILKQNGDFKLDSGNYISEIVDLRLNFDEDCPMDTVVDRDGSILVEICDTIKVAYSCKLAIPTTGYVDYYKYLNNLFQKVKELKLMTSNVASVDFAVDRNGYMKIGKISGIDAEFHNTILSRMNTLWKPADMWGRLVETNYRILIQME